MEKKKYNQHGEGSIKYRKDGRWEAVATYNGRRKSFYGKTEREAKKKRKEYEQKLFRGEKDCQKIRLSLYFESWLQDTKKGSLKSTSYDRLERTYSNHIKKEVGDYQLGNFTTKQGQYLINQKADLLSYSSTKKIYEALNSCLSYAEKVGDINRNPMRAVELPRESNFKKQTKEIVIPTKGEMQTIFTIANEVYLNGEFVYWMPYVCGIMLIANTGVRVGELLALSWDKINYFKKEMSVDCSLSEIINREEGAQTKRMLSITDTKTKNGKRSIPLNAKAIKILYELQRFYQDKGINSNYVICNSKGRITNYRDFKRSFDRIIKKAGIKAIGLHSLRHYFASVCISCGISTFELSRILGHGKVSVTLDTYGHLMEHQEEKIRRLLEVI
ncbi:MAG: tyrosine-type recombinase/integrase [Velocimicrobium sp.]